MNNFEMTSETCGKWRIYTSMTGQKHVESGVFTLQSQLQSLFIVTSKISKGIANEYYNVIKYFRFGLKKRYEKL
jgi:hypothetical protein